MSSSVFCDSFFFFKQKTAYEMRISDWSSDVCSSDLFWRRFFLNTRILSPRVCSTTSPATQTPSTKGEPDLAPAPSPNIRTDSKATTSPASPSSFSTTITRSEEHTSELQSLMRISYAVFCLKKKKNK